MKDRFTQKPRGFGFITYDDPTVVDMVIEDIHIFHGKEVLISFKSFFFSIGNFFLQSTAGCRDL
jgi:RNA recognition motif-containing protein